PSSAVGDPADFLDVDVDQIAWGVASVAHRGGLRSANHFAGQWVTLPQGGHVVAAQDPGHRRSRHRELGTDPVPAPPLFATPRHGRFLAVDRSLGGTAVRPRRAVLQAATAFLPEASDPAVSALSRDALGLRSVSDCPALLADALDEQLPTTHVQPGITVGHEDLRTVGDLDITHRTRR